MKVVAILQVAFQYGTLAEEFTCQIVILIPKCKGDFLGIGLIEVLWKAITSLLNHRITAAIFFHDMLRVFWAGQGTGTPTLEANLLQQITSMREAVLFKVLLDLRKAYDALDQERALNILAAHEVDTRTV